MWFFPRKSRYLLCWKLGNSGSKPWPGLWLMDSLGSQVLYVTQSYSEKPVWVWACGCWTPLVLCLTQSYSERCAFSDARISESLGSLCDVDRLPFPVFCNMSCTRMVVPPHLRAGRPAGEA